MQPNAGLFAIRCVVWFARWLREMKPQYSSGNAVEDETRLRTHDFPVLDRILGAKLLEPAAKNPSLTRGSTNKPNSKKETRFCGTFSKSDGWIVIE